MLADQIISGHLLFSEYIALLLLVFLLIYILDLELYLFLLLLLFLTLNMRCKSLVNLEFILFPTSFSMSNELKGCSPILSHLTMNGLLIFGNFIIFTFLIRSSRSIKSNTVINLYTFILLLVL